MKHGIAARGLTVVVAMVAIACGGPPKAAVPATATDGDAGVASVTPSSTAAAGGSTTDAGVGAATGTVATAAPVDAGASGAPPFAHNAEEATSFIDDAITSRSNALVTCVNDARTRKKNAHAKIIVEVGIDEEGHLLGVELPKGTKRDKPLVDCVLAALRGAPFPRSHAGVITVRRTFEDQAVVR